MRKSHKLEDAENFINNPKLV